MRKIILIGATVVAASVLIYFLLGAGVQVRVQEKLITKDPQKMVLKATDVPAENLLNIETSSLTIENLRSHLHYLPDIWQQIDFEAGQGTQFKYEGGYLLFCVVYRFSSVEGAKILFNTMKETVTGFPVYGRFVSIPELGNEHYAIEIGSPAFQGAHQPVGITFRKVNILVALSTYGSAAPWTMEDLINWARIVENRIS
jgi:hypothetical protein